MAGRRRYSSMRYGAARRGSGDKTLVFCIIGGGVFVFGLLIAVIVNMGGSDPQPGPTRADNQGRSAPEFRPLNPPEEAPVVSTVPTPREEPGPEPEEFPPP